MAMVAVHRTNTSQHEISQLVHASSSDDLEVLRRALLRAISLLTATGGTTRFPSAQRPLDRERDSITIRVLGTFRIEHDGQVAPLRPGSKAEQLLIRLAIHADSGVPRDELLGVLWPDADLSLARQSLNTLVSWINRTLVGDACQIIVRTFGRCRLNCDGGVRIDAVDFDSAVRQGDRCATAGDHPGAIDAYQGAVALYAGDLVAVSTVDEMIERERLRARYLHAMSNLAEHHLAMGSHDVALVEAYDLLARDSCREDAHRAAMRSFVRMGQRAQALRQHRICEDVLARELGIAPEAATQQLAELIRTVPETV